MTKAKKREQKCEEYRIHTYESPYNRDKWVAAKKDYREYGVTRIEAEDKLIELLEAENDGITTTDDEVTE